MKNDEKHLEHLSEIRSLMERSSRFISLSGLSGVFAGVCALIGAAAAYWYLDVDPEGRSNYMALVHEGGSYYQFNQMMRFFVIDAVSVLVVSLLGGIAFTMRRAKKHGQTIWDPIALKLLINLGIPLATGGVFCLILFSHGAVGLVAPATLIFYGLALLNASKYTFNDIRYLGISEIVLGLIAAIFYGHGLIFWAIGFGLLHIVYGIVMYYKYERA